MVQSCLFEMIYIDDKMFAKCPVCEWEGPAKETTLAEHPFKYPRMAGCRESILICPKCDSCIEPDSEYFWRES